MKHMEMKKREYKSAESKAREKAHQFGQPGGNPQARGRGGTMMREFYFWVENVATEDDIKEYVADKNNPLIRRKFAATFAKCESISDFCQITNQTHGAPRQTHEIRDTPTINIILD